MNLPRLAGRVTTVTLLAAGLPAIGGGLAPPAVRAAEIYPVPANGQYILDGHGWGHGRGLNQWGSQGAASRGVAASTILSAYYPGTAPATYPSASLPARFDGYIRVLITRDDGVDVRVVPHANLYLKDASTGASWPLATSGPGGPIRSWRIWIDAAGQHAAYYDTAWHDVLLNGRSAVPGPLRFQSSTNTPIGLQLPNGQTNYLRGALTAVTRSSTSLATVNSLPMEQYVYGVVPRESPASWAAAALQAQAVAARTYALNVQMHAPAGAAWDICDTTMCQVYGGYALYSGTTRLYGEEASTTAAVDATRGAVRTYGGQPIFAQYSASNGGWSTAGGQPYLIARPDSWDAIVSPHHDWRASVTAAQIQARHPSVGRLLRMIVTSRDGHGEWGGRVLGVRLEGVDGAGRATVVNTTGSAIYAAAPWTGGSSTGLRSIWWTVNPVSRVPGVAPGVTPGATYWGNTAMVANTSVARTVHYRTSTGGAWVGPVDLRGYAVGGPGLAVNDAGAPLVFVRGGNNSLYLRARSSTGWVGWQALGGILSARPAAVRWGAGEFAVFARGGDGAVYIKRWRRVGGWQPWGSLGGVVASGTGPAAASPADGQLAVYVRGGNGMLYEKRYGATGWSPWRSVGVGLVGEPAAASAAAGTVEVAIRGADNRAYVGTSVGGGAFRWSSPGGTCTSAPTLAANRATGRLDLAVLGRDGAIWGAYRAAPAGSAWSGWTKIS